MLPQKLRQLISLLLFLMIIISFEPAYATHDTHAMQQTKISRIQFAAKKTFGKTFDSIEPLNAGSSISALVLYKAYLNHKPYVVRFGNEKLKNSRREIKVMTVASQAGITPKIYYANPKDGIIIMDYIKTRNFNESEKQNPMIYKKLAKLAKQIHSLPNFPKFMTVFEIIRYNQNQQKNDLSKIIKPAQIKINQIEKILKKNPINHSIHNDLNPNNILYDGKNFYVIDWELATTGDPFFDLATLVNFYQLNKTLEKVFLEAYFNRTPTQKEWARYYLMKQVSLYYYGLELIYGSQNLGQKTIKSQGLSSFGYVLLKEALTQLNSKEYEKALLMLNR